MTIVELTPRVAVIPGAVNVGVLRGDGGRCVLIDTGLNETSGRKALKAVREELHGEVVAILTTHAHADHFGANAFVVRRTGAQVYAPAVDEAVLRYPLLQPALLFAGAYPPASMRGSFMLADPSPVDHVIDPGERDVAGIAVNVVSLAGHSPNQVGCVVDGVFFCADVVLPEAVLDKYKIPYLFSVGDHLASLDGCTDVVCTAVVPGHGPLLDDVRALRDRNRALVHGVADFIVGACARPVGPESILTKALQHFGASVADAPGYFLLHPTVFAFLSYLEEQGRLRHDIADGASLWSAV